MPFITQHVITWHAIVIHELAHAHSLCTPSSVQRMNCSTRNSFSDRKLPKLQISIKVLWMSWTFFFRINEIVYSSSCVFLYFILANCILNWFLHFLAFLKWAFETRLYFRLSFCLLMQTCDVATNLSCRVAHGSWQIVKFNNNWSKENIFLFLCYNTGYIFRFYVVFLDGAVPIFHYYRIVALMNVVS